MKIGIHVLYSPFDIIYRGVGSLCNKAMIREMNARNTDLLNIFQVSFFFLTCPETLTVAMSTWRTNHTREQISMIVFSLFSGIVDYREEKNHSLTM